MTEATAAAPERKQGRGRGDVIGAMTATGAVDGV